MEDNMYCQTDYVLSLAVALDQAGTIQPLGCVISVIQV
jgi:hypothetical protein